MNQRPKELPEQNSADPCGEIEGQCPFLDRLPLLLTEVVSDERDQLELHLAECPVCQCAFESLTETDAWNEWETLLKPRTIRRIDGPDAIPTIAGYRIEHEIARGGMGVVYKARQESLGRWVALKTFLPGTIAAPNRFSRFELEAQATARLRHAGVVQIYDVGIADGVPYLTMELVEGLSLRKSDRTWSPREAARLIESLARTIDYVHEQGIVHRDLTPGNILLDESQSTDAVNPRITDFGLAKLLVDDSHTQTGELLGTVHYISPENARGEANWTSPASDIYSLGVVFYELLTKQRPFQHETTAGILQEIIHREPSAPTQIDLRIPKDLETICLKCLEKRPQDRYQSAGELASDLVRYRQGRPLLARPTSLIDKAKRWCVRHPAVSFLVASLVLVGAISSGIISVQRNQTKDAITQKQVAEKQAETMREQVDLGLYVRNLAEGNHALLSNDLHSFHRALKQCDVETKSWEWTLIDTLSKKASFEWTHMSSPVKALISGANWVATASTNGDIEVRSTTDPERFERFSIESEPLWLRESRDGSVFAVGTESAVHFVSTNNIGGAAGKLDVQLYEFDRPVGVTFSEDTAVAFLISRDGAVLQLRIEDLTVLGQIKLSHTLAGVSLAPNGRLLKVMTKEMYVVEIDIDTFDEIGTEALRDPRKPIVNVHQVWVSRDEKTLALVRENENRVIFADIGSKEEGGRIVTHNGDVLDVAISPEQQLVASCDEEGFVRISNADRDAKRFFIGRISPQRNDATAVAWLGDDQVVVGTRSGQVRVFQLQADEVVRFENSATFSIPSGHTDLVRGFAMHPKEDYLASCGDDGQIIVHPLDSGIVDRRIAKQPFRIRGLAFVDEGQTLVAACNDGELRFFDFATGDLRREEKLFGVNCTELMGTRDGEFLLVAGGDPDAIVMYDVQKQSVQYTIEGPFERTIRDVEFSYDESMFAVAGGPEVHVFRTDTGEELFELAGQEGRAHLCHFSPDGRWLATDGHDYSCRVWNLDDGSTRYVMRNRRLFGMTSDSRRIVTEVRLPNRTDRFIEVVDIESGFVVWQVPLHASLSEASVFPDPEVVVATYDGYEQMLVWKPAARSESSTE